VFHAPTEGWLAFVQDESTFLFFDGTSWQNLSAAITALQNLLKLGINTTADDTNRLAVKSDAVLFSHDDVTPGTGDVRFKVNKAGATNTASLLFQDNFSGRAEMGLIGDDDFALKVSPDGNVWRNGLILDRNTGVVRFPSGGVRPQLTAPRTYYVDSANGSDTNDGLSAASAFKTIQKAIDTVATLDLSIHNVTIQVADGTYNEQVTLKKFIGNGSVRLVGNPASPANCHIVSPGFGISNSGAGLYWIDGFKIDASFHCVRNYDGGKINFGNMDFGTPGSGYLHVYTSRGAVSQFFADYTISGDAAIHLYGEDRGFILVAASTVTLNGVRDFSISFVYANRLTSIIASGVTWNGSATGMRFQSQTNSVIVTGGAGPDYFPGDVAGSTGTGGIYV